MVLLVNSGRLLLVTWITWMDKFEAALPWKNAEASVLRLARDVKIWSCVLSFLKPRLWRLWVSLECLASLVCDPKNYMLHFPQSDILHATVRRWVLEKLDGDSPESRKHWFGIRSWKFPEHCQTPENSWNFHDHSFNSTNLLGCESCQGMQQLETSKAELEVVEDELEAPWDTRIHSPERNGGFNGRFMGPSTINGGLNDGNIILKGGKSHYQWVFKSENHPTRWDFFFSATGG